MLTIKSGFFASHIIDDRNVDDFLRCVEDNPQRRYETYTSIPASRLNGGRFNSVSWDGSAFHFVGDIYGTEKVLHEVEFFELFFRNISRLNNHGVPVHLALTNHFVDQEDLDHPHLRRVLDFMIESSVENGVIYVNDGLRNHLAQRYPGMTFTGSIIKFYADPSLGYMTHLGRGDRVVMRHTDNPLEFVDMIPEERRRDADVFVACGCTNQCNSENADSHYRAISLYNRGEVKSRAECSFSGSGEKKVRWGMDELRELVDEGFTSFKLGRPDVYVGKKVIYLSPRDIEKSLGWDFKLLDQ